MSLKIVATMLALGALAACSGQSAHPAPQASGGRIPVVTTFSTLNSFVEAVGGSRVSVQNLVPIGASPEDYQPAPQDIATLNAARVLFENGDGIEAWLQHTIANVSNPHLKIVIFTQGLPEKGVNPHMWMDPVLAKQYVLKVRDAFSEIDPQHRAYYARNAAAYNAKLDALRQWIAARIATIPPAHRTMIVFHNAWQYYDDRFGLRTIGVIELSPGQEPNPQYIAHLVDLARKNHVRAVFAEPEYSPKLVDALAKSAGIKTEEDLYDDSIGADPRVKNYIDMMRYDTNTIVKALR